MLVNSINVTILLKKKKKKVKVMDLYSAFQMGYALPKALYM